jgi:hypothetical protein
MLENRLRGMQAALGAAQAAKTLYASTRVASTHRIRSRVILQGRFAVMRFEVVTGYGVLLSLKGGSILHLSVGSSLNAWLPMTFIWALQP